MSTLSQFFGQASVTNGAGGGAGGEMRVFSSTGTMTMPSETKYVAYGALGGGGGSLLVDSPDGETAYNTGYLAGAGAGFSFKSGPTSCASPFTVCAVVGAGGSPGTVPGPGNPGVYFTNPAVIGGNSCVCGISTGNICAVGGRSYVTGLPSNRYAFWLNGADSCNGGFGSGGDINTCGGSCGPTVACSLVTPSYPVASGCALAWGGSGAGGLNGNGGLGSRACDSSRAFGGGGGTPSPAQYTPGTSCSYAGGGGFGSGGGGGGTYIVSSPTVYNSYGGDGLYGVGAVNTTVAAPGVPTQYLFEAATTGYSTQYTADGRYTAAKTFFSAAGGGGAYLAKAAAGGGGGGGGGAGGFGGGGGNNAPGGIGGGAGAGVNSLGGQGIVAIEFWTID